MTLPRRRALALPVAVFAFACLGDVALAEDAGTKPPTPAPSPSAQTPTAPISGDVVVLQASNAGKGIAPDLSAYPDLLRPPLNAYNTYSLIKRDSVTLQPSKASSLTIPNNISVALTYTGVIPPATPKDQTKYVVNVAVQRNNGTTVLSLVANAKPGNQLFLVTNEKYGDGYLVIGIKVK